MKKPIYHIKGCKKIAMYTTIDHAEPFSPMIHSDFYDLNGDQMVSTQRIECGSCGKPIRIMAEQINEL